MWEKPQFQPAQILYAPKEARFQPGGRCFQGIPSVERTAKGRLFACFYGGELEEQQGNYAVLAISDDVGRTWTGPIWWFPIRTKECVYSIPAFGWILWAGFGLPGASRSVILTACMACGPAYAPRRTRRSPFLARRAELPTA